MPLFSPNNKIQPENPTTLEGFRKRMGVVRRPGGVTARLLGPFRLAPALTIAQGTTVGTTLTAPQRDRTGTPTIPSGLTIKGKSLGLEWHGRP